MKGVFPLALKTQFISHEVPSVLNMLWKKHQRCKKQPSGWFTLLTDRTGFSSTLRGFLLPVWSPAPSPVMTTVATGLFPPAGLALAEIAASVAAY